MTCKVRIAHDRERDEPDIKQNTLTPNQMPRLGDPYVRLFRQGGQRPNEVARTGFRVYDSVFSLKVSTRSDVVEGGGGGRGHRVEESH